ncbi:DUF1631 family protein [Aquincola sp. MAHUQ-54]|uniref:DUF1631 family protein n=1 Tax=Aquincola agrisoli TaxID=3119538 RepID=A0AAW9QFV8_9BURK
MSTSADFSALAGQVRRLYTEELVKGMAGVVSAAETAARNQLDKPADYATGQRRRNTVAALQTGSAAWHQAIVGGLRNAMLYGVSATRPGDLPRSPRGVEDKLSLVDDDTIEREILGSRLALAIMDKASWEFTDLRSRMAVLERREELEPNDMMRAHVLARIAVDAWCNAGLSLEAWRDLQQVLHEELAALGESAYHQCNQWLAAHQVLPQVDLRPMIKRGSQGASSFGALPSRAGGGASTPGVLLPGNQPATLARSRPAVMGYATPGMPRGSAGAVRPAQHAGLADETRLMTAATPLPRGGDHAEAVLGRLNKLVGRQLPEFTESTQRGTSRSASPGLTAAIGLAQQGIQRRFRVTQPGAQASVSPPTLIEDLQQRKQVLKNAAETPVERATIEIVALLFQAILTEESIPATVRVWFARLQMPVLRVAVGEPDFFATTDHPARKLIDRMGACVMGFDASSRAVGDALEREIKRVVQVVEAYPDTGRRVFQTVLTEFEKFLEHYFKNENETTRKGVSLAQQVEQRETLAIQYTIELRKMLNEVPVQEGVRQFLFQIWADVLAMTAVKYGGQSDETKNMKRAAADLIWSASAKVSREDRAEVIRRLPPLLKILRDGMASAGVAPDKQDEQVRALNNSLAAAFTAKAAAIPHDRFEELMERLETLEELLPDSQDVQIDESTVLDLSGHESSELEVATEGGSAPTPAMLAWARELQVGSWFMLDFRGRNEPVQLAWQGLRRQLSLFVTPSGRCVLFQQQRLAAFLQAGMLLPAQDEALTVRATRNALARLDVDPARLLN